MASPSNPWRNNGHLPLSNIKHWLFYQVDVQELQTATAGFVHKTLGAKDDVWYNSWLAVFSMVAFHCINNFLKFSNSWHQRSRRTDKKLKSKAFRLLSRSTLKNFRHNLPTLYKRPKFTCDPVCPRIGWVLRWRLEAMLCTRPSSVMSGPIAAGGKEQESLTNFIKGQPERKRMDQNVSTC